MMTKEAILKALFEKSLIQHTNGHQYNLVDLVQDKTTGEWQEAILYRRCGESQLYVRGVHDFRNFTLVNGILK